MKASIEATLKGVPKGVQLITRSQNHARFTYTVQCQAADGGWNDTLSCNDWNTAVEHAEYRKNLFKDSGVRLVMPDAESKSSVPLYAHIARELDRYNRLSMAGNTIPFPPSKVREDLNKVVRELLPSGSGIDNGTHLDWEASRLDRLVFIVEFHHMDDHGSYRGWSAYKVIVKPSLMFDIDVTITGATPRGVDDTKDYLSELYRQELNQPYEY